MEQVREYIQTLHGTSKGWITLAGINQDNYTQWHYKFMELLAIDFQKENIYISQNTFYKPQRRLENIKELRALFIDLDVYKLEMTKQQVLYWLNEEYFNRSIPRANMIIDSGRGLYLIWMIESVSSQALSLWKAIEEYLYKQLKAFGADRKALDATRILRLPTTTNTKSQTEVKILHRFEYLYTLREIQENYLPALIPKKKKVGRPPKIVTVFRERSLYHARIQDLIKVCELRKYDVMGHRELILFLYRYYLCYFTEDTRKALDDTLELNKEFKRPLLEAEAIRSTRSAEKVFLDKEKNYKYKNETLIDLLDITEQEQMSLSTIISKREYRRRDNEKNKKRYADKLKAEGKMSKQEELTVLRQKIKDLKEKGLANKIIATNLDIPIKTLERQITFMKKNKLLA